MNTLRKTLMKSCWETYRHILQQFFSWRTHHFFRAAITFFGGGLGVFLRDVVNVFWFFTAKAELGVRFKCCKTNTPNSVKWTPPKPNQPSWNFTKRSASPRGARFRYSRPSKPRIFRLFGQFWRSALRASQTWEGGTSDHDDGMGDTAPRVTALTHTAHQPKQCHHHVL